MKIKKKKLMLFGAIAAVLLIGIIFIFIPDLFSGKTVYQNIDSPRPILGDKDAKVKIIEFSDIECPACKLASTYPKRFLNDFESNVSVEFRHFPLTSIHPYAYKSAIAAECANDQGKFWEFVDLAYKNQDKLTVSDLKKYGKQVGVDIVSFNACVESDAKNEVVDKFLREGYALRIPGTPTFFVNGNMIPSNGYEDIALAVQDELDKN